MVEEISRTTRKNGSTKSFITTLYKLNVKLNNYSLKSKQYNYIGLNTPSKINPFTDSNRKRALGVFLRSEKNYSITSSNKSTSEMGSAGSNLENGLMTPILSVYKPILCYYRLLTL
jgi:hypothetical protein